MKAKPGYRIKISHDYFLLPAPLRSTLDRQNIITTDLEKI
jgi:hypothetical protein